MASSSQRDDAGNAKVNEYRLNEDNELRLEVGTEEVIVELLEGTAEIFGSPLTMHKRYTLPPGFTQNNF